MSSSILIEYFLDEERVDVDQTDLQQMQCEHPEFLVIYLVGGELAALTLTLEDLEQDRGYLKDAGFRLNII